MDYSSADFHSKRTPILKEINEAAYEIINDRPEGIIPMADGRFTIVRHDVTVGDELICEYRVYSYRTLVAFVTWVDQESLVTSMVRLYAVSAVILAIIMGILTPVHYAFERLF